MKPKDYYNHWNDVYEQCYPQTELVTIIDVCTHRHDVHKSKEVPKVPIVKSVSQENKCHNNDCSAVTQSVAQHQPEWQYCHIDIQYWVNKQNEFANCTTFQDVKNVANTVKEDHQMRIQSNGVRASENFTIDPIVLHLYPSDDPVLMTLVKWYGDGNCFMRSVSKLIFGTEAHHLAVWAAVVLEAVLILSYYLDNTYLNSGSNTPKNLTSQYGIYSESYNAVDTTSWNDNTIREIYEHEVTCGLSLAVIVECGNFTKLQTW